MLPAPLFVPSPSFRSTVVVFREVQMHRASYLTKSCKLTFSSFHLTSISSRRALA
ncbi:hypothetical protein A2U01_0029367 [Trifolium medium]|uniref:Uncharacterized protein n=1 Tax=Trifolium medium TaxID=97028 RepID=A0A392P843_9FABA|nr:hypothetical protein [Trifolium medium]